MSALNKTTKAILKAIPNRSHLPILDNVAVIQSKMVATNLDIFIECVVNGIEDGLYMGDMLKKTGEFVPSRGSLDDFPLRPSVIGPGIQKSDLLHVDVLKNKFEGFAFAAVDATKGALKCVTFTKDGAVTATDGWKLLQVTGGDPAEWETLIPVHALKAIRLMAEYGKPEMKSYRKTEEPYASFIEINAGPARLTVNCYPGIAPNYASVMDTAEYTAFQKIPDMAKLREVIKAIEPYTNKRTCQMIFDGPNVIGKDEERGIEKGIDLGFTMFPNFRVAFNISFLQTILDQAADLGTIRYANKGCVNAVFFRDDKRTTFLLMPLRIIDKDEPEKEEGETAREAQEGVEKTDPSPEPAQTPDLPAEATAEALERVADQVETVETDDFPNPPAPVVPCDKPATYRQIKYLYFLTGRPWTELRELRRKQASTMITELIGKL